MSGTNETIHGLCIATYYVMYMGAFVMITLNAEYIMEEGSMNTNSLRCCIKCSFVNQSDVTVIVSRDSQRIV